MTALPSESIKVARKVCLKLNSHLRCFSLWVVRPFSHQILYENRVYYMIDELCYKMEHIVVAQHLLSWKRETCKHEFPSNPLIGTIPPPPMPTTWKTLL